VKEITSWSRGDNRGEPIAEFAAELGGDKIITSWDSVNAIFSPAAINKQALKIV